MTISDPVADLARDVFERHCDAGVVAAAEGSWSPALWDALHVSGLTDIADVAGWPEIASVARAAGAYAAPVPIVETILARRALTLAGLGAPDGPVTIAAAKDGRAERVPWASTSKAVVLVESRGARDAVRVVEADRCTIKPGLDLAREPRDTVTAQRDGAESRMVPTGTFLLEAALLRAVQIAGALERVRTITFEYAAVREQFGRSISRFQAVQANLALLAAESEAASIAAAAAVDAVAARGALDCLPEIAAAKVRAGMAATEGARLAHQIHGAIGVTHEHRLHHFTTRLWTWRDEHGTERYWAVRLGRAVAGSADNYWDRLTS